jgi:hypothetical protein
MDNHSLWELVRSSWTKIGASFDPAIKQLVANSELNVRDWMLLLAALTFEPEDTTASHLLVRDPYTSSDRYLSRLERIAEAEYLETVAEGSFHLSDKGREAVQDFIKVARDAMVSADLLPDQECSTLVELLKRLVEECLDTPPPPNTWSITLSNKLMPAFDPPMPFIEQTISCLSAYRDDSHLASWQSSGLSAIALESMTLFWRGEVNNLEEVTAKLSYRGHPDSVYMDALSELRTRAYLSGYSNALYLTEEGNLFRDQVEAKTDQYFFTPWSCLSKTEKISMAEILKQI